MYFYVNGDSHTAAAEAVVPYCFAEDESRYFYMGRAPHPENARVAWPVHLQSRLKIPVANYSESASSNTRIIRTTKEFLENRTNPDQVFIIIQWSTWEREEWLIDDIYYQVNASGIDHVPESHQQQYKEYIASVDWNRKTQEAHHEIWEFHLYLESMNIPHLFFNGNNSFSRIRNQQVWGNSYIEPYNDAMTYSNWLQQQGHKTVSKDSYHFGPESHRQWGDFIVQYLINNRMV